MVLLTAVKLLLLVAVWPLTVTEIVPVTVPEGTVTVSCVAEAAVTVAVWLLANFTVLFAGVALKLVPVMMTDIPGMPPSGKKLVMVGAPAVTVKSLAEVPVWPPTVTVIFPVVAPEGTVTVRLVALAALTVAVVLLNLTVLFAGVALKLVPVMVTADPTPPEEGEKLVTEGTVVKSPVEVPVNPPTVTAILPVVAPLGTVTVRDVVVCAVTVAVTPLNVTVFCPGVALKELPDIVTVVPPVPDVGEKLLTVGVTEKLLPDNAVSALTSTDIFPVDAPLGTVTTSEVLVADDTVVVTPLNFTMLFAGVVLKFVPVIVTGVPTAPEVGEKFVIVGVRTVTVKFVADVAVCPPTVTVIVPVVAPDGTVTVRLVALAAVTVAVVLLNFTVLFAGVALKFVPVIVTGVPTGPDDGEKPDMVGTGITVKSDADVPVCPPTVTVILPVVAPLGTVAISCVAEAEVTVAVTLLNFTVLLPGVVLKFVPLMVIPVPDTPEVGVKLETVGINGATLTVKSVAEVAVCPPTVTVILPVEAPLGTVTTSCVLVAEVTEAEVPLNRTSLEAITVLKLLPFIVTIEPTDPEDGVKPDMVGAGSVTVKSDPEVAVCSDTVTVIFPVVAPEGTVTFNCVFVAAVTVAVVLLNLTVFSAATRLKLSPVMTTAVPTLPEVGLKLLMEGGVIAGVPTKKSVVVVAVCSFTVTLIFPVLAPSGTETTSCVADAEVTVAVTPLNFTVLLAAVVLKFDPVIVTAEPTSPDAGVKPEIAGGVTGAVLKKKLFADIAS